MHSNSERATPGCAWYGWPAPDIGARANDEQAERPLASAKSTANLVIWYPMRQNVAGDVSRAGETRKAYSASGGGRNTTSCLAESATTSGGFCSFMPWMAQNRS